MTRRMHDLQWAVSHNSYDTTQKKIIANKHFDVGSFYDAGFRGVELDIVQHGTAAEWCVTHGGSFDTRYKLLSSYLADLRDWSAELRTAKSHEPLFVHLDCKAQAVTEEFPEQLDNYIRSCLGDQPVYTPRDMLKPDRDLMQSAMEAGWPTLDELKGHLIFVLSGSTQPTQVYAESDPGHRVCFADYSKSFPISTTSGFRIIANSDIILLNQPEYYGRWCAGNCGMLLRIYVAESLKDFTRIAALGANMIAADRTFDLPKKNKGYWDNPLATTSADNE